MTEPSGEKRGFSSSPSVSGASLPDASSLIQMPRRPSRSELNATIRPSGDAAGEESWPEYVRKRTTGTDGGAAASHDRAAATPAAISAAASPRREASSTAAALARLANRCPLREPPRRQLQVAREIARGA